MKKSKLCLCFILVLIFVFQSAMVVSAAGTTPIPVEVTYHQGGVAEMLEKMNELRATPNVTVWRSDTKKKEDAYLVTYNPTDPAAADPINLSPLQYDSNLEKVAMQRAAEIAAKYYGKDNGNGNTEPHFRPDGSSWETAYEDCGCGSIDPRGENLAAAYPPDAVGPLFTQWKEDDKDYDGQGHRRNFLDERFNAVGMACVELDGNYYWVQEFGYVSSPSGDQPSGNGTKTVTVNVATDAIKSRIPTAPNTDPINLKVGDIENTPKTAVEYNISGHYPADYPFTVSEGINWASDNPAVASVENGEVTGVSEGEAKLKATVGGTPYEISVTVVASDKTIIKPEDVSLDKDSYEYNGKEHTPAVTVTVNGVPLVKDTDYTVTYSSNKDVGTATVTVKGMGEYGGKVNKKFTITECKHVSDGGKTTKEPGCGVDGEMTITCTKCHKVLEKKPIPMTRPHDPDRDAPTCVDAKVCKNCGAVLAKATGKHVDADKNGKCDVCGAKTSGGNGGKKGGGSVDGTGNDGRTKTGDDNRKYAVTICSFFAANFICIGCVLLALKLRKRRAVLAEGGEAPEKPIKRSAYRPFAGRSYFDRYDD